MSLLRPRRLLLALALLLGLPLALLTALGWRPAAQEPVVPHCSGKAPLLQPGQALKVMTWNVQYLAGKRHVFWYDLPGGDGPDSRPSRADLAHSLDEVVRVLRDEQADIVLLQELHDGARASDHEDQLALLQARLADLYPCSTQAFYWQAVFVPQPHILGSVGMKLATLSRFRISQGERLQLPQEPSHPLTRPLQPKPALLLSHLPIRGGGELTVLNTHFGPFAQDHDTLRRQVTRTAERLGQLQAEATPWVLGGDLNLLPPGQYQQLAPEQRSAYSADSPLQTLASHYPMIPTVQQASGSERARWYTHYPNDPAARGPDRTLDYLLYSPQLTLFASQVRQHDTQGISDHLPLLGRFFLPHRE